MYECGPFLTPISRVHLDRKARYRFTKLFPPRSAVFTAPCMTASQPDHGIQEQEQDMTELFIRPANALDDFEDCLQIVGSFPLFPYRLYAFYRRLGSCRNRTE